MINKTFILMFVIWTVFFVTLSSFWIFKNNLPPAWDQAQYLEASEMMRQTLVENGIFEFLNKTTTVLGVKAPLIAILPVPLYLLFGSTPHVALMVNMIFLILFAVFFYKLVCLVFDEKLAFASIVIIATMPLFYGLARYFFVEFGLMTLVIIWMYLILKTENPTKKYLSLLGVTSGLGMMMKFHFFIFIAGPALLILYNSWKKIGYKLFDYKNLLVFTVPAMAIALPWYARNIMTVLWKAKRASNPELLGNLYYGSPLSIKNLYLSALDFINYVVSPYWFLVMVALAVIYLFKSKRIHVNYFFLSWFLVPFIIFYFGPNKDYRLMLPLLPPVGILIAWLIRQVFLKKQSLFLIGAAVFPTLVYLNTSVFDAKFIQNKISLGPVILSDKNIGDYVQTPRNKYWPIKEILVYLDSLVPQDKTKIIILASEHESFNINNLKYYAVKEKLNLEIKTASYFPKNSQFETIKSFIDKGDYLIMKVGGDSGPSQLNVFNEQIEKDLNWPEIPNNFTFPDGGRLLVAKKL